MTFWASHFAVERPNDQACSRLKKRSAESAARRPGQPSTEELEADRYRAHFVIVFDREGYSPEFFKDMWQTHRVACITYHKFKGDCPYGGVDGEVTLFRRVGDR